MYWHSPCNRLCFKHHNEWGWTTWIETGMAVAAEATRPLLDIIGREGQSFIEWLRMHREKDRTVVFWVSPAYPMSSRTPSTRTEQICYELKCKAGSLCSQGADNLTVVQRQHWTRLTWRAIIWKLECFQLWFLFVLTSTLEVKNTQRPTRRQAVRIIGEDYFRKGILFMNSWDLYVGRFS